MQIRLLISGAIALSFVALWTDPSDGYPRYETEGFDLGCSECHAGFIDRGPLHDMHVGSQQMTNECQLCHVSTGDNPRTDLGGEAGSYSCVGCHGVDNGLPRRWGAGLRLHHAAAGAPADPDGLFCADCHFADPEPDGEDVIPVHYLRDDVNVKDPCSSATEADGEDWDGDEQGLDNDGDLVYDEDDSDCSPLGVGDVAIGLPMILSVSPNPSIGGPVEVLYVLSSRADVTIRVVDASGRRIAYLQEKGLAPGPQRYRFDGRGSQDRELPSGVYLAEIEANGQTVSARIVLLR